MPRSTGYMSSTWHSQTSLKTQSNEYDHRQMSTITVKCPQCGKTVTWTPENSYRPFCSERCKLIDLGEWASETRVISGESKKTYPDECDEA